MSRFLVRFRLRSLASSVLRRVGADPRFRAGPVPGGAPERSLVELLGHPPDARLLIINADDFGMNHATNSGTIRALAAGGASSASLMSPCPWFAEAAAHARRNPSVDAGLHLALTSEWQGLRWGPVAGADAVPSLVDELGYLLSDSRAVHAHATLSDVEREVRAQVRRGQKAGIDITHLNAHMDTLVVTDPRFHQVLLDVARELEVPVRVNFEDLWRMPTHSHLVDRVVQAGIFSPEVQVRVPEAAAGRVDDAWRSALEGLRPGRVSEIYIHPADASDEMAALGQDWQRRVADTDFVCSPRLRQWLRELRISLVGYRDLRALQRRGLRPPYPYPIPAAPVVALDTCAPGTTASNAGQ